MNKGHWQYDDKELAIEAFCKKQMFTSFEDHVEACQDRGLDVTDPKLSFGAGYWRALWDYLSFLEWYEAHQN